MSHRTDIQVRFSDTDAQGHLNNTAYTAYTAYTVYAELARADLLGALRGPDTHLPRAGMTLSFQSQVRFGQVVHVTTDVQEAGGAA